MSASKKKTTTEKSNNHSQKFHYRLLAERSFDLVMAQDMDRKMVYVNHIWTKTLGYSAEESIGKPTRNFVVPEFIDAGKERNQKRKAGDTSTFQYELELVAKNGERIPVEIHSSPLHSESGEIVEILIVARDLRQQKKTQAALLESETRYQGLFESAPIAIWAEDFSDVKKYIDHLKETGISDFESYFKENNNALIECVKRVKIVEVNETAVKLHGAKDKGELLADGLGQLFVNDSLIVFRNALLALIAGDTEYKAETKAKRLDGELFDQSVHWRAINIDRGDWGRIIVSTQDISDLKDAEKRLTQQLNELNVLQATAFTCAQAKDIDSLLRQITNIIGNTLYPDIYGIFLTDEKETELTPHASYSFLRGVNASKALPFSRGLIGKAARTRKTVREDDVSKSKDYLESSPSIRSELCVPIKVVDRVLGVLDVESVKPAFFTETDERLLGTIASQIATAIQKLASLAIEKERRQVAETLQRIAAALTTTLDQEKVISLILSELSAVIDFTSASVQLLRDDHLEIVSGHGKLVLETEKDRIFPYPGDNPNTVVLNELKPYIINDAQSAYPGFLDMPSIKSWLGIPLIRNQRAIGLLTVDSEKPAHFTSDDAALVTSFANHAAISLENAQLFKAEQKRREEAETLRETALAITSSLDLDSTIQQILEQLARVLPYDSAAVQIIDDDHIVNIGGRGWKDPEAVMNIRFPFPGDNPNTEVVMQKKVVILQDAQLEHAPFREYPHNYIRSWMGIPMIIRNEVVGILTVDSKETNHFNEASAQIATVFATQAAIAIENARLYNAEQTRRHEAETLRQAAHTISSSLDLEEVLATIFASIRRVIPFYSAAVLLLKGDRVEITSGYNLPENGKHVGSTFSRENDVLLQQILTKKHPIILKDASEHESFGEWGETNYVRGWMGVPLIVRGEVIGYITLDSREVNAYDKKHAELAQVFAHQAASAIANARLYQDAIQTAERKDVLHRVSQDISRGIQSPDATYQAIHQATQKMMPCDAFVIVIRGNYEDDKDFGVYLIDEGKQYPAQLFSREKNIITLTEQNGGSFITQDLTTDKLDIDGEKSHFGSKKKVRSILVSPMYSGENLIGAISAQSYSPNAYGKEEQVLLEMLASHAAAAIENMRLLEEAQQRSREFAELHQISQDLVTDHDTDKVLTAMLERATRLIGVSVADIYTYDEKSNSLIVTNVYGLNKTDAKKLLGTHLKIGEGMAGKVAQDLQPMRVNNSTEWEERNPQFHNTLNFTTVMELPLVYRGNLLGVLALFEIAPRTHNFTDNEERIIELFAAQLASALHSAKQLEQITTRLAELEAINNLSMALRKIETPEGMLPILLDEVKRSLHVEVAMIWMAEPHSDQIYRAIECGWVGKLLPKRQKNTAGLIGHVFTEGKIYQTNDIATDPHIKSSQPDLIPPNWRGLWVPIRASSRATGVIGIMAEAPREFSNSDRQILNIMAEMAGNAFHRARLHRQTEQQLKRLTALRNIDISISAHTDLHTTLQLLIEQTIKQLEVDATDILLVEKTTKNLKFYLGNGFKDPNTKLIQLRAGEGLPGKAIRERRILHSNKLITEASTRRQNWFTEEGFHCYYCIPLNAKGNILGVLEVFKQTHINTPPEWMDFLETLAGQAAIAIDNHELVEDLKQSNEELAQAYDTTLEGWGKALELRDRETQGHTLNVTELTLKLARYIGIPENELTNIYRGALLHDIGKMGIPDNILHKPGPLTKEEWKVMRQHPQLAYNMISSIPYLHTAIDIPYCHHERWDGTGYPRGLKGEEIPLAARIFSVIDVWDALLTDRPYREAWPHQVVIDYICNESGTRFDPNIVEIFIEMIEQEEA